MLQYSSIYRSTWHANTLPLLQLTLCHSCKRPFGTQLGNPYKSKLLEVCLVFCLLVWEGVFGWLFFVWFLLFS